MHIKNSHSKSSKGRMIGNVPYHKAYDKMRNIIFFETFKKSGKNICCRCGNKIETCKEFTLDHVIPWRNKPKEEALKLLVDKDNIKFAHKQCNVNDTQISKSGYWGVTQHPQEQYKSQWQARFKANKKTTSLKYWKTPEQAAIMRDLYAYRYYNGNCRLNFPQLKEFYKIESVKTIEQWEQLLYDQEKVKNLLGK